MNWRDLFVKNDSKTEDAKDIIIVAPCSGKIVALDDVPDEVFSKRMIGDGVAIMPSSNRAVSVLNAPYSIFTTCHAISFEGPKDLETIVHIGINTVSLKGEGFQMLQKSNEGSVDVGSPLVEFDKEGIEGKGISLLCPVVASAEKSNINITIIPEIGSEIKEAEPLLKVSLS